MSCNQDCNQGRNCSCIPSFTEHRVAPTYNLEHQISLLRGVNQCYKDRIDSLSMENVTLRARLSVVLSMLCDAGIPLPDDIS